MQIGNEPNIHGLDADGYATLIKAIAADADINQLREEKKIMIVTAGLSPSQDNVGYARTMLNTQGFYDAFDIWGTHPYPSWPEDNAKAYEAEIATYSGFDKPILITEGGQGVRNILDDQNVEGAIKAFKEWNSDDRVMGVTLFILVDTLEENGISRAVTSWIGAERSDDTQWRPQYKALMVGGSRRGETGQASCKYDIGAIGGSETGDEEGESESENCITGTCLTSCLEASCSEWTAKVIAKDQGICSNRIFNDLIIDDTPPYDPGTITCSKSVSGECLNFPEQSIVNIVSGDTLTITGSYQSSGLQKFCIKCHGNCEADWPEHGENFCISTTVDCSE